ncbi:hypothetical protein ACJJTC_016345 [Scirpophaga incertulas]
MESEISYKSDKTDEKRMKELIIKRSSVKGQITKFKKFLSNISQRAELASLEFAELTLKLGKFESLSVKFDELQSQIEVLNAENLEYELTERENIEHDFVANIAMAKSIIECQNKFHRRESFLDAEGHYSPETSHAPVKYVLGPSQPGRIDVHIQMKFFVCIEGFIAERTV